MNITSVNIKIVDEEPVCAYVSINFDDCFAVRKIRIIKREDLFQIAMPSMKSKDGRYQDVCHPTNQHFRKKIVDVILRNYHALLRGELTDAFVQKDA